MPSLDMTIPHDLEKDEALMRIKRMLVQLKQEKGDMIEDLREDWDENSCKFSFVVMGSSISGTFENGDNEVRISADLPFAASLFKGKIESVIREKAEELLG